MLRAFGLSKGKYIQFNILKGTHVYETDENLDPLNDRYFRFWSSNKSSL